MLIEYVMNINFYDEQRQLWSRNRGTCGNGSGAPELSFRRYHSSAGETTLVIFWALFILLKYYPLK